MTIAPRGTRPALRVPAPPPGRAGLDPIPRLARRHRRSSGSPPSGSGSTASRTSSSSAPSWATCSTSSFYADLETDQQRLATMSMLRPAADAQHHGAGPDPRHGVVLRRPDPALHAPGRHRPPPRLAVTPARHPRLAARARHVGRRGPHPPLPHQGARRAALHLPAVLRALHPDGPGRQQHPHGRQAQAHPQTGRPVRRAPRLSQGPPRRARRGGLRRRRGQRAVEAARGVPDGPALGADRPRHPAGHQGPDGPAPALAAGRRGRGPRTGSPSPPSAAASTWPCTPTSTT